MLYVPAGTEMVNVPSTREDGVPGMHVGPPLQACVCSATLGAWLISESMIWPWMVPVAADPLIGTSARNRAIGSRMASVLLGMTAKCNEVWPQVKLIKVSPTVTPCYPSFVRL